MATKYFIPDKNYEFDYDSRVCDKRTMEISKLRLMNMFLVGQEHNPEKYSLTQIDTKILTPVSAKMLDILTERDYGEYGEDTILEELPKLRDVTIVVQIHQYVNQLVYAIGIVGAYRERTGTKDTLDNIMEMEEEKLDIERTFRKFERRSHSLKYFMMKLKKIYAPTLDQNKCEDEGKDETYDINAVLEVKFYKH